MKICAFMTSYNRFYMLVKQIYNIKTQTRLPDKTYIFARSYNKVEIDYLNKLQDDKIEILFLENNTNNMEGQVKNYYEPFKTKLNIDDYDLIVKLDDDDIYPPNYIEKAEQFHILNPNVDLSGQKYMAGYHAGTRTMFGAGMNGPTQVIKGRVFRLFIKDIDMFIKCNSPMWDDTLLLNYVKSINGNIAHRESNMLYYRHDNNTCQL